MYGFEMSESRPRILVVDDTPSIHADFDKVLGRPGTEEPEIAALEAELFGDTPSASAVRFRLDHASQGQQGVELLDRALAEDDPFSVAFVDMRMPPGWDGLRTVQELWARDARIQTVICTAYSDHDWSDLIETLGTCDRLLILKKPFDVIELRQMTVALAEKWRLERKALSHQTDLEELVSERTEALRLEMDARARQEVELRQANKLQAVGELASGIAHEINTPIQYVGDRLYFIQEAYQDLVQALEVRDAALGENAAVAEVDEEIEMDFLREEMPKACEAALEGVGRVANLVRAMRDFARADQVEKTPSDINQAIRDTLVVCHNSYKYAADVETDLGDIPLAECHIGELNQVFLNLVVNAAHAIEDKQGDDGGPRGTITFRTRKLDEFVEIRVTDTGGGIPESAQERIFDPFFTTKEVGRGTGQGLAIARSIVVDKHGGDLRFETEAGVGTTFVILVPLKMGEAQAA